jgi:hypothetical protein
VNPSNLGQLVTFTTTILAGLPDGGTPTGTITFKDGNTVLGSSAISDGQAGVTTSALSGGTHTIVATYSGDADFNPNAAPGFTQTVLSQPMVNLSPTSLNFPIRLVGSPSPSKPVTLTNTGGAILTITSIAVTGTNAGDFSQTNDCGTTVAIGASCTINVTFLPTAKGPRAAAVTLTDDAQDSPQSVPLTGIGTVVKLVPAVLNFGDQQVGSNSQPKTITLTNLGTAALNITSVTIGGANAADFSQTNDCGSSVAGGASCSIAVVFTPLARGARAATLGVSDDGGGSPQTASLSGNGT